jgi:hypothetical protein
VPPSPPQACPWLTVTVSVTLFVSFGFAFSFGSALNYNRRSLSCSYHFITKITRNSSKTKDNRHLAPSFVLKDRRICLLIYGNYLEDGATLRTLSSI